MCHKSGRSKFHGWTQVEVMNESLDCLGERYAVIEAGNQDRPERFVLAYYEEKSLRDLIAATSIIAVGFASREQAAANIEGQLPAVAGRAQVLTTTMENRPERHQTRCHRVKSSSATWRRWVHPPLRLQKARIGASPRVCGRA